MKRTTKIALVFYLLWMVYYFVLGSTGGAWIGVYFGIQALLWVVVLFEFREGYFKKPVDILIGIKSAEVLFNIYRAFEPEKAMQINESSIIMLTIGVLIGLSIIFFRR